MTATMTRLVTALNRIAALSLACTASALPSAAVPQPAAASQAGQSIPAAPGMGAIAAGLPGVESPMLGRIQIFEDWAVGCDNRLSCSAVSLVPEGAGTAYSVLVSIQRAGGSTGEATLRLIGADHLSGQIDIVVDNKSLTQATANKDMIELTGPLALDIMRALGSSYAFEVRERPNKRKSAPVLIDAPSLRGLPAALRYIDEQQGRVGSKGALAALGDGPADLAKPLPPDSDLAPAAPAVPDSPPPIFTAQEQIAARQLAACEGQVDAGPPLETHRLDPQHALILLPCDSGAYNVSMVPLLATGGDGQWRFSIARFDHVPGFTGDPGTPPMLVNARWNPARGELSSFAKGRGLGDCGTAETYRWDGALFRLTEARSMPVCRGAWEWPVLYSAVNAKG